MTIYEFAAICQITASFVLLTLLIYLVLWGIRAGLQMNDRLQAKQAALGVAVATLKEIRLCLTFTGPADEDELRQIVEQLEEHYKL